MNWAAAHQIRVITVKSRIKKKAPRLVRGCNKKIVKQNTHFLERNTKVSRNTSVRIWFFIVSGLNLNFSDFGDSKVYLINGLLIHLFCIRNFVHFVLRIYLWWYSNIRYNIRSPNINIVLIRFMHQYTRSRRRGPKKWLHIAVFSYQLALICVFRFFALL